MKRTKKAKILVFVIIAAILLQAGVVAYSMLGGYVNPQAVTGTEASSSPPAAPPISAENSSTQASGDSTSGDKADALNIDNKLKDGVSLEVSQSILDTIKTSDAKNFTKNVDNYKSMLKTLNVHIIFKNEMERLIKEGKKLPDILMAYTFLNGSYGSMTDIEKLAAEKETGKKWADIFKEYNTKNPPFMPRDFDAAVLDKLLKTPGVDQEDVMIADRVSQKTKIPIEDLINKRSAGSSWRLINAECGIVNGQEKSPHLSVTREQLVKYASKYKLSEKKAVEALSLASKLDMPAEKVLDSVRQGLSKADIYAAAYTAKYY